MKKEKQEKKLNCSFEKIKEDKDKREFIKKSLFGLGTAGIAVGVLASPFGSSITWIGTTSLNTTSTTKITNLNADFLDGKHSLNTINAINYLACSGCAWTCSAACTTACSTGCTGNCSSCTGNCLGCTGCTGSCTNACSVDCGGGCAAL